MTTTVKESRPSLRKIARYYRGARTVHIERLREFEKGDFLYFKPMYDFDPALAEATQGVSQVRFSQVWWRVLRKKYEFLELAEPYTPSALPQNVALTIASYASLLGPGKPTRLVTYAIENSDLALKLSAKTRLSPALIRPAVRALVGFCFNRLDRVVFGTEAALENYRSLLGPSRLDRSPPSHTLIWGLPLAEPALSTDKNDRNLDLIFLGALDSRKGIANVMGSWDAVARALPNARLTILGKGPLQSSVEAWATPRQTVKVCIDPSRESIQAELRKSKALVLLSQPSALWKEQIGLPILEALSFGLEIIASNESGIAPWLADHGHNVLDPAVSSVDLAEAIVSALTTSRTRSNIAVDLPATDGRLDADRWLFGR